MSKSPKLRAVTRDGVDYLWVDTDLDSEWRATYRLVYQNGALVIGEVRVLPRQGSEGHVWTTADKAGLRAVAPRGGVRATLLRQVSIPAVGQYARQLGAILKRGLSDDTKEVVEALHVLGQADVPDGEIIVPSLPVVAIFHQPEVQKPGSRRGRKGKGELFYARVARTYVAEARKARPRPLEAIRKLHRLDNVNQARTAVYRAREKGLLGGRQPGKVSGFLTPKAKAVLGLDPVS